MHELKLLLLSLLALMLSCQAQSDTPHASSAPPGATAPSAAADDFRFAQAAKARKLKPVFSVFYKDSLGQFYWASLTYSDSEPESEENAFVGFDSCPPLDSASFHDVDSSAYSTDKNGVYYLFFSGHNTYFEKVVGADPASFRAIPNLEAGYDRKHVFLRTTQLPKVQPASLRVFEGPENSPVPCGKDDLYFVDSRVVVKNQDLTAQQARSFQPPLNYRLGYTVQ